MANISFFKTCFVVIILLTAAIYMHDDFVSDVCTNDSVVVRFNVLQQKRENQAQLARSKQRNSPYESTVGGISHCIGRCSFIFQQSLFTFCCWFCFDCSRWWSRETLERIIGLCNIRVLPLANKFLPSYTNAISRELASKQLHISIYQYDNLECN